MQLRIIFVVAMLAVFAITCEASPAPLRYVTPKPGVRYSMRVVTPKSGIRYLRSVDADEPQESHAADMGQAIGEETESAEEVREDIPHGIEKRSPERVVINYKPPPANGPRYA